jgi:prophage regulatory protein
MPPRTRNPLVKPPALPEVGFVRLPQILAVYPVGRSTWWAGVKTGRFPAPVKLGPRITTWPVQAVRELIERDRLGLEPVPGASLDSAMNPT